MKLNRQFFSNFFMMCFAAFNFFSCADRTTDDYQRDKLNQSLNTYQAVTGVYTGAVKSNKTGQAIGAIELGLQVQTKTSTSTTGDTNQASPVLITNLRFLNTDLNTKMIQATTQNSYYDQTTKQFHTEISVTRSTVSGASAQSEIVSVTGILDGDQFNGEIKDLNDPDYAATLQLVKNGSTIEKIASENKNQNSDPTAHQNAGLTSESLYFSGQTQFLNISKALDVIMVLPFHQTAEDLLNIFSATRDVSMSFNYGKSLHINFSNVLWDRRQGFMSGQTTVVRNNEILQLTIECHYANQSQIQSQNQLVCKNILSNSNGPFVSSLNQTNLPVTDPTTSDISQPLISKIYAGSGQLGGKTVNDFRLNVSTISQSAADQLLDLFFPPNEKTLGISFNAGEGVSIYFSNIRWDVAQATLDGQTISSGAEGYTAYLKCSDFYFTNMTAKSKFSCHYWTNRSPDIFVTYNGAAL